MEEDSRLSELRALVQRKLRSLEEVGLTMTTWREPVPDGICDDCKPFIKDEPTKWAKLTEGRQRVIMSFSLEDQVVDRMLFGHWIEPEVNDPLKTVQKGGWSVLPTGYQLLLAAMPDERRCLATDMSAWDFTVPSWAIDMYLEFKLAQSYHSPEHVAMIRARFAYLYGEGFVFRLPNGARWRQNFAGMMKSGSLLTLSMNSFIQGLFHYLACIRTGQDPGVAWAMGDDFLAYLDALFNVAAYDAEKARLGGIVKFSVRRREFAGMLVKHNACEPLWQDKHKFTLAWLPRDEVVQYLKDITIWYARSKAQWFSDTLKRMGIPSAYRFACSLRAAGVGASFLD